MADDGNDNNLLNFINDKENENNNQNLYSQTLTTSEIPIIPDYDGDFTLIDWAKKLEKIYDPYSNKDEIPILKIDNKDCFFNGEKITQLQLSKAPLNDDNYNDNYNKCKNCKVNYNTYFCKKCRMNICEKCSKDCDKVDLINLKAKQSESDFYKNEVVKFVKNIVEESEEVPFAIYLIKAISVRKYNNYFHYQNIYECHKYCQEYEEKYKYSFLKIKYNVNEDNNNEKDYKIFGKIFVENNNDKISLVINGIQSPLVKTAKINDNDKDIEVVLIKNCFDLDDLSYMFSNCKSKSIEITEIKNRETFLKNVKNISYMFNNCSYLKQIDLHFFRVFENVVFIDSLFNGCKELENISNLTHLNTISVTKMYRIFSHCQKLKKIDDNFTTDNVESFDEMFKDCSSLIELPENIPKWKMEKAKSFRKMFKDCSSLKKIPDFKGLKVQNIERMFEGCSALKTLPNISDWDIQNVKSLKGMFKGCSNLEEIPKNIANWDVKNVINMKEMFYGCKKIRITNLPDLKNWNLENLKTMKRMFFGCSKLIEENFKIENLFTFRYTEIINLKNILE